MNTQTEQDIDMEDDYYKPCSKCGEPGCDGLTNCSVCGEDADCTSELCDNCQRQKDIDDDPFAGDPRVYWFW